MSVPEKQCSVNGCDKAVRLAGMCGAHHQRKTRGTDMNAPMRVWLDTPPGECSVDNCKNISDAKGTKAVCAMHRGRMSRNGGYTITRMQQGARLTCTIPGCVRAYRSSGMCNSHNVKSKTYSISCMQMAMLYGDGSCDSCGGVPEKDLHIDHDHNCCAGAKSCGACVRGVLCSRCNIGLGCFSDSPDKLSAAMRYLERNLIP